MARATAQCDLPTQRTAAAAAAICVHKGRALEKQPEQHELFKNWTRSQLRERLCSKMGGAKKYTTLSRKKLIDMILKLDLPGLDVKQMVPVVEVGQVLRASVCTRRKQSTPVKLGAVKQAEAATRLCENAACRAKVGAADLFCHRCSCCICYKFDDNKDPSLWLECSGETTDDVSPCGLSCHINCALGVQVAGVVMRGDDIQLDGSLSCHGCGYISSILGSWMKQLQIAKEARRVSIFLDRLARAIDMLGGTVRFKELHKLVSDAYEKLREEVGHAVDTCKRRLINRMACGAEVLGWVNEALSLASSRRGEAEKQRMLVTREGNIKRIYSVRVEEITCNSVTILWTGSKNVLGEEVVGHSIWCRLPEMNEYPSRPICSMNGNDGAKLTGLDDGVDYIFKLIPFTLLGEVGEIEVSCSTPLAANASKKVEAVLDTHRLLDSGKIDSSSLISIRDVRKLFTPPQQYVTAGDDQEQPVKFRTGSPVDISTSSSCMEQMNIAAQAAEFTGTGKRTVAKRKHDHQEQQTKLRTGSPPDFSTSSSCMEQMNIAAVAAGTGLTWTGTGTVAERRCSEGEVVQSFSSEQELLLKEEEDDNRSDLLLQKDFEFSVKVVLSLEEQGYIRPRLRMKLLSWLGFQATQAQKKVICIFIKALLNDPLSLALQLMDTFQEILSMQRDCGS